ncbi:hypothetical protein Z948_3112 [Sulfitobacter donghicola DSW-25 = KCTC 12864 = JCM 14565]|uniref:Uncharacterized protein n=1 Tax=Sulfitobacter donghicola DSW-25 = KCTC 12864 = JCM 14565 TaxID=1300350 RepID=A0A073IIS6_9RHOB|nr:hypothetical protein DSW25_11115 [Sulfitobacter donghicola DSW-25 = KCTC 12864 = JCM 14565]KIN69372.1 hypothetical protein Z948_3112 [Sulfitobacter donghicola DSW-25 = KCTC 12864 = JCM 14565]
MTNRQITCVFGLIWNYSPRSAGHMASATTLGVGAGSRKYLRVRKAPQKKE